MKYNKMLENQNANEKRSCFCIRWIWNWNQSFRKWICKWGGDDMQLGVSKYYWTNKFQLLMPESEFKKPQLL